MATRQHFVVLALGDTGRSLSSSENEEAEFERPSDQLRF
jgi:hypothetical protein